MQFVVESSCHVTDVCCDWQLDVAQMLARPVIIIDDRDNITAMLNVLRRFHMLSFDCHLWFLTCACIPF